MSFEIYFIGIVRRWLLLLAKIREILFLGRFPPGKKYPASTTQLFIPNRENSKPTAIAFVNISITIAMLFIFRIISNQKFNLMFFFNLLRLRYFKFEHNRHLQGCSHRKNYLFDGLSQNLMWS
jgi:hypothetical protein